ncbi:MAG: hypothetical protein V1773_12640 [bacterium]
MVILIVGCANPFAPALDEKQTDNNTIISNRDNIQGVFQNLQYAYTFKDSTIYGELLPSDFLFTYRDYDRGIDVSWGRDEELRVTSGLFQNAQRLDLIWNNIISATSDSTNIVRSFNLTITFNPTDIIFIEGRVNLSLKKDINNKWQIYKWLDESNY